VETLRDTRAVLLARTSPAARDGGGGGGSALLVGSGAAGTRKRKRKRKRKRGEGGLVGGRHRISKHRGGSGQERKAEEAVIRVGQEYQAVLPSLRSATSVSIAEHLDERQNAGTDASLCERTEAEEGLVAGWQGSGLERRFVEAVEAHGKNFEDVSRMMNRATCAPALGEVLGSAQVVTVAHVTAFYYRVWRHGPGREAWNQRSRHRNPSALDR
jgi:hypothetical protein